MLKASNAQKQAWRHKPSHPWIRLCTNRCSFVFTVWKWTGFCSPHLVSLGVWTTLNTSGLSDRLLSPDESVCRASLTHPCPVDHVVPPRTGNTGGVGLIGAQGTAATLWGYTTDDIGDVDGVDLCNVTTVFPLLGGRETLGCQSPAESLYTMSSLHKGTVWKAIYIASVMESNK